MRGNDARGVLFGVGRLLRELRMDRDRVLLPSAFRIATAPRIPVRGHQLGYRPKTNSYDAWDVPQWEQAIRDLAVFGTNIVELIPPRSDDDADSPHFPRPPMEMMIAMSRLLDEYGLDVGIWYPAMEGDYADPKVVRATLTAWDEVFRKLPRVDAVFVPGGDPGHSRPRDLMPFLEKAAEVLHRSHPRAGIWVSTQGFDAAWQDEFTAIIRKRPSWLAGLVYGPHTRADLDALRASVPESYPIRLYPDITHTIKCQFPVEDWDLAYFLTEGREPINPRPRAYRTIFRSVVPGTIGFVSYSEGCNDDVNKIVWSALGWDPDAREIDILREYGRYFIGPRFADGFAQGLLAPGTQLGRSAPGQPDDRGDAAAVPGHGARGHARATWRTGGSSRPSTGPTTMPMSTTGCRTRRVSRTARWKSCGGPRELGSIAAMDRAEAMLDQAADHRVAPDRRARVSELAEAPVPEHPDATERARYQAIGEERGANLDAIDAPLNNRAWLQAAVRRDAGAILRTGTSGRARGDGQPHRSRSRRLLRRASATRRNRPHLVPGPGLARDPMLRLTRTGVQPRPDWPMSWRRFAESLYDAPLRMHYTELDPEATYRIRIVYTGDRFDTRIRLTAEGVEVHPWLKKPEPIQPVEFDVPRAATADGTLDLTWTQEPGRGGNGRGCQVAEVWLIRARNP